MWEWLSRNLIQFARQTFSSSSTSSFRLTFAESSLLQEYDVIYDSFSYDTPPRAWISRKKNEMRITIKIKNNRGVLCWAEWEWMRGKAKIERKLIPFLRHTIRYTKVERNWVFWSRINFHQDGKVSRFLCEKNNTIIMTSYKTKKFSSKRPRRVWRTRDFGE